MCDETGTALSLWMNLQAQRAPSERAVAFRRTVDLCQHRITELKDYVDSIFQAVMAHRFRCPAASAATNARARKLRHASRIPQVADPPARLPSCQEAAQLTHVK